MSMTLNQRLAVIALIVVVVLTAGLTLPSLIAHAQSDGANCTPRQFAVQWPDTNFCETSIDFSEVLAGGPAKDGIPAVDDPEMVSVDAAREWLVDRSPVIAVEIDGDARAYPQSLLMWHEIANDTVGGVPVAVTFCPLCNSSIVFDRRLDGQTLTFGVSGLLRNSDMVMFDRQTESWWQQLTGRGIVGEYNEALLDIVPSQVIGFAQFAEHYPDGLVMSLETGFNRNYGRNPYVGLDDSRGGVTALFQGDTDPRLPARERVLAIDTGDVLMAYSFNVLATEFAVNDTLADTPVVAFWQPGVASSLDTAVIDDGREIGTAALYERVLDDGTVLTFVWDDEAQALTDEQTGSTWNLFGEAIDGQLAGTELRRLAAAPHYWFAWAAFHPETQVYGIE